MKGAQVCPAVPGTRQPLQPQCAGTPGPPQPLNDWLKQQAALGGPAVMHALMGATLAGDLDEAAAIIEKLEQLLATIDDLRQSNKSTWQTMKRFLGVPAVGSLNQLRTELQMRYGGHRVWVRSKGRRKID